MVVIKNELTYFVGESIRITAQNLKNYLKVPITVGATVTMWIYDATDATIIVGPTTATATAIDGDAVTDDWAASLTAPAAGDYVIRVESVSADGTFRGKEPLKVLAW